MNVYTRLPQNSSDEVIRAQASAALVLHFVSVSAGHLQQLDSIHLSQAK